MRYALASLVNEELFLIHAAMDLSLCIVTYLVVWGTVDSLRKITEEDHCWRDYVAVFSGAPLSLALAFLTIQGFFLFFGSPVGALLAVLHAVVLACVFLRAGRARDIRPKQAPARTPQPLTVKHAEAIAQIPSTKDVSLDGPITLSDEAAKALAQRKGRLSLNGLGTLSDAAAKALAQHRGLLILDRLTTLSDEAAKALAQHEGGLSLNGLTTLSGEAAAALNGNPEIHLPESFAR